MRLSLVMFRHRPHGIKYRGTNRVVRPVKLTEFWDLRRDYERTEENMLYLRHPYLTVEQSHGHMGGKTESDWINFVKMMYGLRQKNFAKVTTLQEHLGHLRVKETWD